MLCFGWQEAPGATCAPARRCRCSWTGRPTCGSTTALASQEGLDLPVRFNSLVAAGWGDYWLDPTDDKSG